MYLVHYEKVIETLSYAPVQLQALEVGRREVNVKFS